MSFYKRVIFPRLCEMSLNTADVARQRQALLGKVHGKVLEIGFGTGLNLRHYPPTVRKITTVDPNAGMHAFARERIKQCGIEVDHRALSGEQLPFESDTFDSVVCTFTLCSIPRVDQATAEVYRVLKPGGGFHFLEHGLSPDPRVQKWQHRLNWLEMRLADGCRLDRDMRAIVAARPFSTLHVDQFYLGKFPKTHCYMYQGIATKG